MNELSGFKRRKGKGRQVSNTEDVLISMYLTRNQPLLHEHTFKGHRWTAGFLPYVSDHGFSSESIHDCSLCTDSEVYSSPPVSFAGMRKLLKHKKEVGSLCVLLYRSKLKLKTLKIRFFFLKLRRSFFIIIHYFYNWLFFISFWILTRSMTVVKTLNFETR